MQDNYLDQLVSECVAFTAGQRGKEIVRHEVEEFLRRVLFTEKDLWWALTSKLLSTEEVASAITDRFHTWLLDRIPASLPSKEEWERLFHRLVTVLAAAIKDRPDGG